MTDEKEVAGTTPVPQEGLSSEAAAKAEAAPLASARKKKAKDRSPEEARAVRKYNLQRKQVSRAKDRNATKSDTVIKPKEAREILRNERNIRNLRVNEVCIELAQAAARNLKIPFNRSLFTKGVQGTLAALAKKEGQEFPPNEWHPGEKLREHELYALWDYATSWRKQPNGEALSFEEWKSYRRRCITDLIWYGNTVLGKDFQPEPHGRWADELFPKLEAALLSLPENFTQKDVAEAFYKISDVRQRCLIAARNSFKSTVSLVFLHQLNLAFGGSVRCLICSATQPLAKGFASNFRSTLTLRDPNNPTLQNQLWPEHCIEPDEGKTLEYTSPFRQLDMLIEPTVRSFSIISEGAAGGRYDYCCFEDVAEISNSSTPEMRAKTQERADLMRELAEPHALTNYVGTPTSAGAGTEDDPGDLYSVLLRREERNQKEGGEPKLLYTICPAWAVNSWVYGKTPWDPTLKEDEVSLLFPSRLTFKYLMGKLKECLATDKTAKVFRQQSLCAWVPDQEDGLRCQFDSNELRRRTKGAEFFGIFPSAQTVMAMDRAFSISRYADFSCLVIGKVQPVEGKTALVLVDCKMERLREAELVKVAVDLIQKHHPSVFTAEQDKGWMELAEAIRRECLMRGVPVPYFRWKTIIPNDKHKVKRVKQLELPIADGRFWFTGNTTWIEQLLLQFEKFDGVTRSNSTRKDDGPDACSILWQEFGPRYQEEVKSEDHEQREQQLEEEAARVRRQQMYQTMFSSPYAPPPPPTAEEPQQPQLPQDPRSRVFSYKKVVASAPNERNKLFGNKGPWHSSEKQ